MRVVNKSVYDSAKYNLAGLSRELNRANEVVSTGSRINSLSDDPVGVTQALNVKAMISNIEQLKRGISLGNTWLGATENALNQAQEIIIEAKALCVQMASGTAGTAQRYSAALTVENMYKEIISLANTKVNGRYIFSGLKTDIAPFDQSGTYSGDNRAFTVKIGKDSSVEVGNDGEAVFKSIFSTLESLKLALESDDVNGIGTAMSGLDDHIDGLSRKISDVGSKMLRMEIKEKMFEDLKISSTERLSEIQDADIAEAILELKSAEYAYQAALASTAKIMALSLMDFME